MKDVSKMKNFCLVVFIVVAVSVVLGGCSQQNAKVINESTQSGLKDNRAAPTDKTNLDGLNKEIDRVLQFNKEQNEDSDFKFIRKIVVEKDNTLTIYVMDQFAVFQSPRKRRKIINTAQRLAIPIAGYHLNLLEDKDALGLPTKVTLESGLEGKSLKDNNFDFTWDNLHIDSHSKKETE